MLGTIIAAVALAAIVAGIIIILVKDKRNGKTSCGCNCAHCAMAEYCHKKKSYGNSNT